MRRYVDRVLLEYGQRNDIQRSLVGRRQHHVGGRAIAVSLQPIGCGDAPAIAGHKARELVLGHRGAQIIPDAALVLQELSGHYCADGVAADVLGTSPAAAISVETGHRVAAAWLEFAA